MNNLEKYSENTFDRIKHINKYGQEFWYARELQKVLEYVQWRRFSEAIERAKISCSESGFDVSDHFADVGKMLHLGVADREIQDIELSRYACYLIVMNGDPRKEVIALGQSYFAVKTRQQELIDNYEQLSEDQKRMAIRKEMKHHNRQLADAAHNAGVIDPKDYAIFQNYGYMGLYGGLKAQDIRERRGLKPKKNILDYMGSTELAANLFRATQTEEKLRRENIQGKAAANQTHFKVGQKVRETIKELGGTMPENLSTPSKSIHHRRARQDKSKTKKTGSLTASFFVRMRHFFLTPFLTPRGFKKPPSDPFLTPHI